MRYLKPHFWYNKSQRNGVLFLLLIIVLLQLIYSFVDFPSNDNQFFSDKETEDLQLKIDSLKKIEIETRQPEIYPFNPNYITDYKGAQLGMSLDEIDRLLAFRKQNKFINSVKDFKAVTKVSDSLLQEISPYFKFPKWVVEQQQKEKNKNSTKLIIGNNDKLKISTTNLNLATAQDFETIEGVNEFLAERIIKYRNRLQGFTFESQLFEVWKLEKEVAGTLLFVFKIKDKPVIKKLNVNIATFKQVLSNPYIDYGLCKKIFEFRDEVAELQSIEELKNIDGFPKDKYDRIILYLEAK